MTTGPVRCWTDLDISEQEALDEVARCRENGWTPSYGVLTRIRLQKLGLITSTKAGGWSNRYLTDRGRGVWRSRPRGSGNITAAWASIRNCPCCGDPLESSDDALPRCRWCEGCTDRCQIQGWPPLPLERFPSRLTTRVVGVSFVDGWPENMGRLELEVRRHELFEDVAEAPPAVTLVRRPDNPYDANAVEVHVDRVGMIGHLDARTASRLAPRLDAGEAWAGEVAEVVVDENHPGHPGISVSIHRV